MAGKCNRMRCPLQYKADEPFTDECNAAETCPYRTTDLNYDILCVGMLMAITGASVDKCAAAFREAVDRLKGESTNG